MESDIKFLKTWTNKIWSRSLVPVLCLILGALMGTFYIEGRVLDDCKYNNGFRVGSQSFTCTRKI